MRYNLNKTMGSTKRNVKKLLNRATKITEKYGTAIAYFKKKFKLQENTVKIIGKFTEQLLKVQN